MANIISPKWAAEMKQKMGDKELIEETLTWNKAIQFLIVCFTNRNIPFKLYNLGAGVKKITTNTDTCPCCKRKL